MAAESIDYHRDTQNAVANGNVKATYTQQQKNGPRTRRAGCRFAEAATVRCTSSPNARPWCTRRIRISFYGTVQSPARMWQDAGLAAGPGDRDLTAIRTLLKAWGEGNRHSAGGQCEFHLGHGCEPPAERGGACTRQTLVYSDKTRQGDFHGTVVGGADRREGSRG